jgi:hypothetical protein
MWGVAVGAVFSDITMFKHKRPVFLHMAAGAGVPHSYPFKHPVQRGAMGIMAVKTVHLLFPDRVMGEQAELGFHIRMALVAQFCHLLMIYLLLWAFMQFMAGKAADLVQGMGTAVPV